MTSYPATVGMAYQGYRYQVQTQLPVDVAPLPQPSGVYSYQSYAAWGGTYEITGASQAPVPPIDHRCENGRFPVHVSRVTLLNPDMLSSTLAK
jgi:hypothetical protein